MKRYGASIILDLSRSRSRLLPSYMRTARYELPCRHPVRVFDFLALDLCPVL
jgi:hypothetical protein